MPDTRLIDQAFQRVMRSLVDTGRAPHYAELARALGLAAEEGRSLLRDVMQAYPIGWLHPETDYIASFPPLNNLPTQYRITVRGEQRWFAQCGFEATSATWLFPGETVRVDAPCLDCADPVTVEMRDGRIVWLDPPEVVGHLNYGFGPSRGKPQFLCTGMNLFRSEEHARRWPASQTRGHMLDADYLSAWYPRRAAERRAYLESIGKTTPFWLGTPDA